MSAVNVRREALQAAAILIAGGLVCAEAAWVHMRALAQSYGVICGAGAGALAHCPACYASAALIVAGAAAIALARRPLTPVRVRSRPSA